MGRGEKGVKRMQNGVLRVAQQAPITPVVAHLQIWRAVSTPVDGPVAREVPTLKWRDGSDGQQDEA